MITANDVFGYEGAEELEGYSWDEIEDSLEEEEYEYDYFGQDIPGSLTIYVMTLTMRGKKYTLGVIGVQKGSSKRVYLFRMSELEAYKKGIRKLISQGFTEMSEASIKDHVASKGYKSIVVIKRIRIDSTPPKYIPPKPEPYTPPPRGMLTVYIMNYIKGGEQYTEVVGGAQKGFSVQVTRRSYRGAGDIVDVKNFIKSRISQGFKEMSEASIKQYMITYWGSKKIVVMKRIRFSSVPPIPTPIPTPVPPVTPPVVEPPVYIPPPGVKPPVYVEPPVYIPPPTEEPISPCFIATAAYGTPFAKEIDILRAFRDNSLEPKLIGKKLINTYYKISPSIANFISRREKLRAITRFLLNPIVRAFKRGK